MELLEYISKNYPETIEEHKRLTTPFYYEPGVLYHPITSGFGTHNRGGNKPLEIIAGTYYRDGDIEVHLKSLKESDTKYGVLLSEAHLKIKRIDESIAPVGRKIPNDRNRIYMNVNGIDWNITQMFWRNYGNQRLGGRVWITQDTGTKQYVGNRCPYYELYFVIGKGVWNLRHIHSYDSVGRENYDIKFGISVREFKQRVFGDPNIKLKCQLFP
jgi:hypothetical protein